MRKLILLPLFLCPLLVIAQAYNSKRPPRDSVEYYEKEVGKLWMKSRDSLLKTEEYKQLNANINRLKTSSSNYIGTILFADVLHSDYAAFNESIAKSGFGEMKALSTRFGFGFTSQYKQSMFDFYFATIGLNNKSSKGDESIKLSLSNILQFEWGYDLLKSRKVNLYPFLGFSLRSSTLEYSKPTQTNPAYTNVSNIITNNQSSLSFSTKVGYQTGIGLDVLIGSNQKEQSGTYLFTKFGTNRAFGADKYKIEGVKYEPGIKQGDWLVSIGFKFVNWR